MREPPSAVRRPPSAWALVALLALAPGCVIGKDKYPYPSELSPSWRIDKLRLLAVQPEPPEAAPGETVHFTALVADPNGELADGGLVVWLVCTDASGAGCDPSALSSLPENPTPEDLAAAGIIGIDPFYPPTYVPDASLLDGLSDHDRLEGVEVTVQVAAIPASALTDTANPDDPEYFNQVESGYKRLVVSEATTPNHNPSLVDFTVDGLPIAAGAALELDADQTYDLGLTIPDESIEPYTYVTDAGDTEERVEEPYLTWFVTSGDLAESVTLYPYTQATWTAPASGTTGTIWAVARDRRGGQSWWTQPFEIR